VSTGVDFRRQPHRTVRGVPGSKPRVANV